MVRSSKVFMVLLPTLYLMAFVGHPSLLMGSSSQSHATHFVNLKGPQLPQDETGCSVCHADGRLQCQGAPIFADSTIVDGVVVVPQLLETTAVCDSCHSPDGAFPGGVDPLWDPAIGAKANWESSVYDSQYQVLPYWHDDSNYETGDIVLYGSPPWVYVAKHAFTSGSSPSLDHWKLVDIWKPSFQYYIGDLVKANGKVWRSRLNFISGPSTPDPDNWELVKRTGAGKESLLPGKEKWCATCHDDEPANSKADGSGVNAPNVLGDNSAYGFYVSGHGRTAIEEIGMTAIEKECLDCHNSTFVHIDHDHRTYEVQELPYKVVHSYKDNYRLKEDMIIPRDDESEETAFRLCMSDECHVLANILAPLSPPPCQTNFRHDGQNKQYHEIHLVQYPGSAWWDSDWDGCVDSAGSCPACHNIHGSPMDVNGVLEPNPVMIRHGELISTPTIDKVPALNFHWYTSPLMGPVEQTNVLQDSYGGIMECGAEVDTTPCIYYVSGDGGNHVCQLCHLMEEYYRTP